MRQGVNKVALQLFAHNEKAYHAAVRMMEQYGKAAIVHPTGTGKSYIAFKLIEDNPEKTAIWLSPSEYIFKTQLESLKRNDPDFPLAKVDLDRQLLKPLAGTGKMFCYDSPEYVKDMGTPERYHSVCKDCEEGRISAKNLKNKQKAIFLDRDGTINKYVGFLRNIDDFELIDGVAEAIRKINESGYLAIVVTNQPVIARGEVSFEELEEIHNKMETLLGKEGAYLDAIYYCPHHPHKGYEGERPELKIDCDCRKPKPGMLLKAAADFNIDLSRSWMVGDGENDIQAGINAGCKTVLLSNGNESYGQTVRVTSLAEFTHSLV